MANRRVINSKKSLSVFYLILLMGAISSGKCKKSTPDNPYGLPNATETGSCTFACLLNKRKYISFCDGVFSKAGFTGTKSPMGFTYDTFALTGTPKESIFKGIGLQFNGNLHSSSSFTIDSIHAIAVYLTDSTCFGVSSHMTTVYSKSGNIQLTKFDTVNKIISGTFSCDFVVPGCDTLHATYDGFDYHYY